MDVRYNVPSEVEVKIFNFDKVFASGTYPMGQFGNVEHLGRSFSTRKWKLRCF